MIDFDVWRHDYDTMTYADHVAFYDRVWELYPVQQHFDSDAVLAFFAAAAERRQRLRVVEVGGWRGEVAGIVLAQASDEVVASWLNLEICRGAARSPATGDPRYAAAVPEDFAWTRDLSGYDVLFASHVIEHMRADQLRALLAAASGPTAMYLASPLWDEGRGWEGYNGSHILESGWRGVEDMAAEFGWSCDRSFDRPEVRVFWRPGDAAVD